EGAAMILQWDRHRRAWSRLAQEVELLLIARYLHQQRVADFGMELRLAGPEDTRRSVRGVHVRRAARQALDPGDLLRIGVRQGHLPQRAVLLQDVDRTPVGQ